jgi:hypothetical protein
MSPGNNPETFIHDFFLFLVLGFLHGVRDKFSEDVSETVVGPIFTGQESEPRPLKMGPTAVSETSSGNLPRTVQKPQNQKSTFISRWNKD